MLVVEKIDGVQDESAPIEAPRPNLAGPFPNSRCKEVVWDMVARVDDITMFCKFTERDAHIYTLGLVQGARIVAKQDPDSILERFIAEMLGTLNDGGVSALMKLAGTISATSLDELTVAEAA